MKNKRILKIAMAFIATTLVGSFASAKGDGGIGIQLGFGVPYVTQGGLLYKISDKLTAGLSYNSLKVDLGESSASMTKPELDLKFHPFSGSFFLGLGLGQLSLTATGTDTATSQTATVDVKATTLTATVGWLWGISSSGFFGGLDFGYQSPSGAETTITSILPTTDPAYIDAVKQGNDLGETAIPLFTLLRLGYLF